MIGERMSLLAFLWCYLATLAAALVVSATKQQNTTPFIIATILFLLGFPLHLTLIHRKTTKEVTK